MHVQTALATFGLRDPSGFSMSSGAKTTAGRALSGKLHGYRKKPAKDIITMSWPILTDEMAVVLQTHIYEGRYQLIRLKSKRFSGTVQYLDKSLKITRVSRGHASVTLNFRVFQNEDFVLTNGVVDYNALIPEHLK